MSLSFQSSTINNFLSSFTSFMNSQVSENVNKSLANCSAMNVAGVNIGDIAGSPEPRCVARLKGSQISIIQEAKALCNLDVQNQTEIFNNVTTGVENNIKALLTSNQKASQEFLALGQAALNMTQQQVVTQITNDFVTSISQRTTNICQSIFQATNNGFVTVCGDLTDSPIDIRQNATVTALTSCVNKLLQVATSKGTALNDTLTKMDTYQATEQKGVGSVLMWVAIIGGIVLVILIVGAVIWFFFIRGGGGGGGSTTQIYAAPRPQSIGTGPTGAYQFAQSLL